VNAGLPDGYRAVKAAGVSGFSWAAAAPWLEAIVREGRTLDEWAAEHAGANLVVGGRAGVRVLSAPVSGPDRRASWAFRRYRRGGAAAPWLSDRYLATGESRPLTELRASVATRSRGLRTPAVVAGAAYRAGPFYRADHVTELVPDAPSLADVLFGGERASVACVLLESVGRLVRELEEARVLHRDLNAGNVVVPSGPEGVHPWVLDLDRCRILALHGPTPGNAMRRRLERSLAKLGEHHGRPLTALEWEALRTGYEERP
jgi:3-deoxy-D-manno-octulosonic acid kinase